MFHQSHECEPCFLFFTRYTDGLRKIPFDGYPPKQRQVHFFATCFALTGGELVNCVCFFK